MVLVLSNDEMDRLQDLPMAAIVAAMEDAFRELGQGVAVNPPRRRLVVPPRDTDRTYWFNNIMGAVPGSGLMALRIDSAFFRLTREAGGDGPADGAGLRKERAGDFVGLVLLFDLETADLVAVLHDHFLSTRRVAATSAVGAKYLARPDARVLGLFGSGRQAAQQVPAMAAVRPLELVKVYSPNPEHRREFAARLGQEVGVEVRAVDDPRAVVAGSDIIACATNSRTPVFDGAWLAPGMHVVPIVGTDQSAAGSEIDATTVRRADVVVANLKEQIAVDRQPKLLPAIEAGALRWEEIHDLAEVVAGRAPGRASPDQITLHDNNTGMGIQFAALGALILQRARAQGLGRELPADLFATRGGTYAP